LKGPGRPGATKEQPVVIAAIFAILTVYFKGRRKVVELTLKGRKQLYSNTLRSSVVLDAGTRDTKVMMKRLTSLDVALPVGTGYVLSCLLGDPHRSLHT
jgi:hypothetical protein